MYFFHRTLRMLQHYLGSQKFKFVKNYKRQNFKIAFSARKTETFSVFLFFSDLNFNFSNISAVCTEFMSLKRF